MSTFPQSVERWRGIASAEISRQSLPLPVELVLAVIRKESGGNVNAVSSVGALGLMQVMPATLRWYNDQHNIKYTEQQFAGDPTPQIKVGIWVLKSFWKSAYRYLVQRTDKIGVDLISKISSIFYVAGPGNARSKLDKTAPSYDALAAAYPDWSPIKNGYATRIWDWTNDAGAQWDTDAINRWLGGDVIDDDQGGDEDDQDDTQKNKFGAFIALGIMVAAYFYFKKAK